MGEVFLSRDSEDDEADESETFGDYIIEEKLGSGGQGVVFKARKDNESVALKIAAPLSNGVDKEVAALKALKIQHPNIVSIKEAGVCQGNPFIALELVDGKNLEQILGGFKQIQFGSEEQFMPLSSSINIMSQLAGAVGYAHQKGVVHGDLKPANVLVTPDNKVKITDFGLSSVKSDLRNSFSTSSREVTGSVRYMSPQRQRGEPLCPADDVYALGVIWYQILTNGLPIDNNFQLNPSDINKSLPKRVDKIYQRLIAAKPEERYQSAEALASELKGLSELLGKEDKPSLAIEQDNINEKLTDYCLGPNGLHRRLMALYEELRKLRPSAGSIRLSEKSSVGFYIDGDCVVIDRRFKKLKTFNDDDDDYDNYAYLGFSVKKVTVYDKVVKPWFLGFKKVERVEKGIRTAHDFYCNVYHFDGSKPSVNIKGDGEKFFNALIKYYHTDSEGVLRVLGDFNNLIDVVRGHFKSDFASAEKFLSSRP